MSKKVLVEGEAVKKDGPFNTFFFYEEEFTLDDAVESIGQARSMIQAGLINERLRDKNDGFRRVRTCQVVSFEASKEEAKQGDLDKLLLKATELGCMPENIDNYRRPDYKMKALERAISLAEQKLKGFKQEQLEKID